MRAFENALSIGHTRITQVIFIDNLPFKKMKLDPYNHKENFLRWKLETRDRIPEISASDSDLILRYLNDMEKGINISSLSAKGSRSYSRLNSLRTRMIFFSKKFNEIYNLEDMSKVNEDQLISFFADMKNGTITRRDGECFLSVDTYVKIFKAFWHWWMKVNRKKGLEIKDITVDLDAKPEKPKWVYLTEEQVRKLCENARYNYKILIMFLFDSGIRAPTELMNVRVSNSPQLKNFLQTIYNVSYHQLLQNPEEFDVHEEVDDCGNNVKTGFISQLKREAGKALGYSKPRIWSHEHPIAATLTGIAAAGAASGLVYALTEYFSK